MAGPDLARRIGESLTRQSKLKFYRKNTGRSFESDSVGRQKAEVICGDHPSSSDFTHPYEQCQLLHEASDLKLLANDCPTYQQAFA